MTVFLFVNYTNSVHMAIFRKIIQHNLNNQNYTPAMRPYYRMACVVLMTTINMEIITDGELKEKLERLKNLDNWINKCNS